MDEQLLQKLIVDLRNILNISQPSSYQDQLAEIQSYCEKLIAKYPIMSQKEKEQIDSQGGVEPLRKIRNSLKSEKNTDNDKYRKLNNTVKRYEDSEALEAIYHISEPTFEPICTLTTLINFFSILAHQPLEKNAVTSFYTIKSKLLDALCNTVDKNDLAIIPSKSNADSVVYYRTSGQGKNELLLFGWHIFDKDLHLNFNPHETDFYKELEERVQKFSKVDRSNSKQVERFVAETATQPLQSQKTLEYYTESLQQLEDPITLNDEVIGHLLRVVHGNSILNNTQTINRAWTINTLLCQLLGAPKTIAPEKNETMSQPENTATIKETSEIVQPQEIHSEEFIGGGSYEEPLPIVEDPIRSDDELWQAINSAASEQMQKLQSFITTDKQSYGIPLSDVIKMEIMQTAFHEGIINSKELENQQMVLFESMLQNATEPNRVEMKSCGKDSDLKADWNNGKKYFVIRPQANMMAKPILWEMVGDIPEIFGSEEYQGKLQKTTGRTVSSVNNLPLIEKLLATKEQRKEEIISPNEEPIERQENSSVFEVNADIISNLCAQPDFSERFDAIYHTMSSEKKVLFVKMLETFMPEIFHKNPDRKGGQDR